MKKINIVGLDQLRKEYSSSLSTEEHIIELYRLIDRLIDLIDNLNGHNAGINQNLYDMAKYIVEVEHGVQHEYVDEMPTYIEEAYLDVTEHDDEI